MVVYGRHYAGGYMAVMAMHFNNASKNCKTVSGLSLVLDIACFQFHQVRPIEFISQECI